VPKPVSLSGSKRLRFTRGDSGGNEGKQWARLNRGELGRGIVPGAGDGDAERGRWTKRCKENRVMCTALGISLALQKTFKKEYLDSSLWWLMGTRSGSGSISCPADRGRLELERTGESP
jgi:hypothetical protein